MLSIAPENREKLLALVAANQQLVAEAKHSSQGLLYDAFVALLGEGATAPRRTRSWATPEWFAGQCPRCERHLRLLLVPTLDVIQCVYCTATLYTCLSPVVDSPRSRPAVSFANAILCDNNNDVAERATKPVDDVPATRKYLCRKCNQPKKGHLCPGRPTNGIGASDLTLRFSSTEHGWNVAPGRRGRGRAVNSSRGGRGRGAVSQLRGVPWQAAERAPQVDAQFGELELEEFGELAEFGELQDQLEEFGELEEQIEGVTAFARAQAADADFDDTLPMPTSSSEPPVNMVFTEVKDAMGEAAPELLLSARSESGYKGVHRAGDIWQAQITFKGRTRFLGFFTEVEKAALAYALTLRAFTVMDERGRLRPISAPRRPLKFARDRPVSPTTTAVLTVCAEVAADADDEQLPCLYLHPIRKKWMAAAWCGSALGEYDTPDAAAEALIEIIECANGDRTQPPSGRLQSVTLLPAPSVTIASAIAEVVADLVTAVELGHAECVRVPPKGSNKKRKPSTAHGEPSDSSVIPLVPLNAALPTAMEMALEPTKPVDDMDDYDHIWINDSEDEEEGVTLREYITLREHEGRWYEGERGEAYAVECYRTDAADFKALAPNLSAWTDALDVPRADGTRGGPDPLLIKMVAVAAESGRVGGAHARQGRATVLRARSEVVGLLLGNHSPRGHTLLLRAISEAVRGRRLAQWMYEAYLAAFDVPPGSDVFVDLRDCGTRANALPSWAKDGFNVSGARPGEAALLTAKALSHDRVEQRRAQWKPPAAASAPRLAHIPLAEVVEVEVAADTKTAEMADVVAVEIPAALPEQIAAPDALSGPIRGIAPEEFGRYTLYMDAFYDGASVEYFNSEAWYEVCVVQSSNADVMVKFKASRDNERVKRTDLRPCPPAPPVGWWMWLQPHDLVDVYDYQGKEWSECTIVKAPNAGSVVENAYHVCRQRDAQELIVSLGQLRPRYNWRLRRVTNAFTGDAAKNAQNRARRVGVAQDTVTVEAELLKETDIDNEVEVQQALVVELPSLSSLDTATSKRSIGEWRIEGPSILKGAYDYNAKPNAAKVGACAACRKARRQCVRDMGMDACKACRDRGLVCVAPLAAGSKPTIPDAARTDDARTDDARILAPPKKAPHCGVVVEEIPFTPYTISVKELSTYFSARVGYLTSSKLTRMIGLGVKAERIHRAGMKLCPTHRMLTDGSAVPDDALPSLQADGIAAPDALQMNAAAADDGSADVGAKSEFLEMLCSFGYTVFQAGNVEKAERVENQLSRLPPKAEIVLFAPMSLSQLEMTKELLEQGEELRRLRLNSCAGDWEKAEKLLLLLRECCNHPFLLSSIKYAEEAAAAMYEGLTEASGKLRVLDRLLQRLLPRDHRVVIFAQNTSTLDILERFCNERLYSHVRLDGTTNHVNAFKIILCSTRAGDFGVSLTFADTVVLYDSDFNPKVDRQAIDRIHRIGQTRPVIVWRLLLRNSVEARIAQREGSESDRTISREDMLGMLSEAAAGVFHNGSMHDPRLTDAQFDQIVADNERAAQSQIIEAAAVMRQEHGKAKRLAKRKVHAIQQGPYAAGKRAVKQRVAHDNCSLCQSCWDGGSLVMCDYCPVSMCFECAGVDPANLGPKWRCPHHACHGCGRKAHAAGGLLFRCAECSKAFCEDCLPRDARVVNESERFRKLGYVCPKSACYVLCTEHCAALAREHAARLI